MASSYIGSKDVHVKESAGPTQYVHEAAPAIRQQSFGPVDRGARRNLDNVASWKQQPLKERLAQLAPLSRKAEVSKVQTETK